MDIAAILIGVAMAALVAAYVAEPLLRRRRRAKPASRDPRAEVEAEYRAALRAIRDLDFDFQTGKLLEADYRALRERSVAEGAALLKRLDQLALPGDDALEAAIRARRKRRLAGACPACGRPYQAGDRFCGQCGAALGNDVPDAVK